MDFDNDPDVIIQARPGVNDLGLIDGDAAAAAGVPPGPIRLLNGWPGAKGWGYRHVMSNPDRLRAIEGRGYPNAIEFAWAVAQSWTRLHRGPAGPQPRVSVVSRKDDYELALALHWTGTRWSVTTMLPFRRVNYPLIYEKM